MSNDKCLIEIMEEVYNVWDHVSKEKARTMLKKLLLANNLNTIEEKRLVWHNLATISIQIENGKTLDEKDMSQAKHYSKTLLEMLDNYSNYKNTQINKERYCRALNNYTECFKDELTKDELECIYSYCYNTYKDYTPSKSNEYLEKIIAKFNISLIKSDFNEVLLAVKDLVIHNNTPEYQEELEIFKADVKNISNNLYQQVLLLIKNLSVKIS